MVDIFLEGPGQEQENIPWEYIIGFIIVVAVLGVALKLIEKRGLKKG